MNGRDVAPDDQTTSVIHAENGFIEQTPASNRVEAEVAAVRSASAIMECSQSEMLPSVMFRMPNTAFGIGMGLAGHAIMWKGMRNADFVIQRIPVEIIDIFNISCWYSAVVFSTVIGLCYIYKVFVSFPLVMSEWVNDVRCHFFNAPNLIFIMLLLGLPDYMEAPSQTIRILWALSFCYQIMMTSNIYKALMFSKRRNFTEAKPQFLLSTVGWFLLSALGQTCKIRDEWGIGLPTWCFGAGFMLYIDIVIFIFGKLHQNVTMRGSPAMFLLIAPPSVGVVALDLLNDDASDFSQVGEMLLGWVFVLLLLLVRMGPIIWRRPSVLGEYWAYVFPLAAATNATIRYATVLNTRTTGILATIMIFTAIASLVLVLARMSFHMYRCLKGNDQWRDPLFEMEKYSTRHFW